MWKCYRVLRICTFKTQEPSFALACFFLDSSITCCRCFRLSRSILGRVLMEAPDATYR